MSHLLSQSSVDGHFDTWIVSLLGCCSSSAAINNKVGVSLQLTVFVFPGYIPQDWDC